MLDAPVTAVPQGAAVAWRFDPRRERPVTAAAAVFCALAMCALLFWARLPFVLTAALSVVCIAWFAPALCAVECQVDTAGIARRALLGWERRPWSDVRRLDRVAGGLLASPFARANVLDFARAMLLPMPAARRDELRAAVLACRSGRG
jgi:hypothetical protein